MKLDRATMLKVYNELKETRAKLQRHAIEQKHMATRTKDHDKAIYFLSVATDAELRVAGINDAIGAMMAMAADNEVVKVMHT